MFTKTQDDVELERIMTEQKESFVKKFQKNYNVQQLTLNIFQKSIEHCDFNRFSESRIIWNVASYINIVSFDLKTIGENLFFSKNEWGKRYFARQSALIIYEAINDIFDLLGKDFRNAVTKLSKAEELILELKDFIRNLNDYKSVYFNKLKEIRHSCAAHRDKDSIEQIKVITSLSWAYAIEFTTKFDKLLMILGQFSQKVIDISLDESEELRKLI